MHNYKKKMIFIVDSQFLLFIMMLIFKMTLISNKTAMGIVKTSQDIRSICLRDEAWTHLVSLVTSGMHNYLMAQFPWDPVR
jgi:hypothetical protein